MEWRPKRRTFALDLPRDPARWQALAEEDPHPLRPRGALTAAGKNQSALKASRSFDVGRLNATPATAAAAATITTQTSWGGLDPLSAAALQSIDDDDLHKDPLSAAVQDLAITTGRKKKELPKSVSFSTASKRTPAFSLPGKSSSKKEARPFIGDDFEPWTSKKTNILAKYTTAEKLSIKSSFLAGNALSTIASPPSSSAPVSSGTTTAPAASTTTATTMADKVRHRLEQLDEVEEGSVRQIDNLSQAEYVARLQDLSVKMLDSWRSDQRVKALKIAIQSAKLLADSSIGIKFYPSKFVIITDILDEFGRVVFERIQAKIVGESDRVGILSTSVTSSAAAAGAARETCRNWFYKIASIRELIPRLYVEAALLRTYSFLLPDGDGDEDSDPRPEYTAKLHRLALMSRGIGDPLVAAYVRLYLARVAVRLVPEEKILFTSLLRDFLATSRSFVTPGLSPPSFVAAALRRTSISLTEYNLLFVPPTDFLLQCLLYKAPPDLLDQIFQDVTRSADSCPSPPPPLVLNSLISFLPVRFVYDRTDLILELIGAIEHSSDSQSATFPKYLLIRSLGHSFLAADHLWRQADEQRRLVVLNNLWKSITRLRAPADYIHCVEVWAEFVVRHYGSREVNTILGDVIGHLLPDRSFEAHYSALLAILNTVLSMSASKDGGDLSIFSLENLMRFLDHLLQKDSVRLEGCKMVLETFNRNFSTAAAAHDADDETSSTISEEVPSTTASGGGRQATATTTTTCDPVILNGMMSLCKVMHDSLDALALADERRQIADLIRGFIRRVNFGRDFEAQLNFYVECRGHFSNLDPVIGGLVEAVLRLALETGRIVRGHHTRKTSGFVRACVAYAFITIPSLEDLAARLDLYLLAAEVALVNCSLAQAEALLKSAILLLPELPIVVSNSNSSAGLISSELHHGLSGRGGGRRNGGDDADGGRHRTTPATFLLNYTAKFLSLLLLVPDHVDHEPLYLFRGLFNALATSCKFESSSDAQCVLYFQMLSYLSTVGQATYPYHIDGVESNDSLYGGDPNFLGAVETLRQAALDRSLEYLKELGDRNLLRRQASLALDLFCRVLAFGDLTAMVKFALNLWNLAVKTRTLDRKQIDSTMDFVRRKQRNGDDPILEQLLARMEKSLIHLKDPF